MVPSESVHAFNLESRRWKVSGKDERGGGRRSIVAGEAHEPFQLLRVLQSKENFKDLAGTPLATERGGMGRNTLKDKVCPQTLLLEGQLVIVWKRSC
ncbi:hypothetical protein CEXT_128351 [Caerostris extrusa]|uniref:Uncharacterized protein n=1 Tax=Caerostris extrusa TaxID=172846 RepID=A0AAV4XPS3_CAEEX|nr:hypothetical protein CEXT_128351 [Caerostris extrusa]